MTRKEFGQLITAQLEAHERRLSTQFSNSGRRYFLLDSLLPEELAAQIHKAFPVPEEMHLRRSLREVKYVAAQMDRYTPILEEALFAFQDQGVLAAISKITGMQQLEPDAELYAGGISVMGRGHFLNPHLDNSHDRELRRYRALNLLYYASPGWQKDFGGNLELWPEGTRSAPLTLPSLFNRLIVMTTNRLAWHSVSRIAVDSPRCCVSNYYFSTTSPEGIDYFHPTSFRGRPEQPVRDLILRGDALLRAGLRKIVKRGLTPQWHYYRRSGK
jgi:Rps23 Pro-64 3,4-dihydroxylase Tpa1-like proline 4-hydroxylase